MNEIEKMYKNIGIGRRLAYFECHRGRSSMRCCPINSDEKDEECSSCYFRDKMKEVYEYPSFTAEKQLKLIKWFINSKYYRHAVEYVPWILNNIAMYINSYWDVFTDAERIEIKEILDV